MKNILKYMWLYITVLIVPALTASSKPEKPKPIREVVSRMPDRKCELEPHQNESFISDLNSKLENIDYGQDVIGGNFISEFKE